jgi:Zn-finger nucleic acid-binding protein
LSGKLVNATGVLCRLLEQSKPTINGAALLGGEFGEGGHELVRERLLVLGPALSYVTCPDCGIEMARVVRSVGVDQVLLYCDECGEVDADRALLQTYTVSLSRFIDRMVSSLELTPSNRKAIDNDISWRLGVQEHKRGKAQTWYFARHLNEHTVARHLLDQIRSDNAAQSAKIITSTDVPLPDGSPLVGYDIKNLAAIARMSQNVFLFFDDRAEVTVIQPEEETEPVTSLRHVRHKAWAYVDGVKYELEGMQQKILLALMDAHAHRLEGKVIADRCGSDAFPFQPAKYFGRNNEVYKAFVRYVPGDKVYELIIHPEDADLF